MTAMSKRAARAVADLSKGAIVATVDIAAPPERVFRAITASDEVPKWWGSPEIYRTTEWSMDLCEGGAWKAVGVGADGVPFTVEGEVVELDPPRALVYTWRPAWDGGHPTTVSYRLDAIDGGTRVVVRHDGFGDRAESCDSHALGWEQVLSWLTKHFAAPPQYFLCRLLPPRPSFPLDMSDTERAAMGRHVAYWAGLLAEGRAIVFGPVGDPKGPWGVGVVRANSEAEVREIEKNDPAISSDAGLRYEVLPMMRAVHR
jgi:uncharacterized protein YndB with AHSA1/START domain